MMLPIEKRFKEYWEYFITLASINLKKTVSGEASISAPLHLPVNRWDTSGQYWLGNSVHVDFLKLYGDRNSITAEEFSRTAYYEYILMRLKVAKSGHFFGITDPARLVDQANYFLKLYHSMRNGTYRSGHKTFASIGKDRSKRVYPCVERFQGGVWIIRDGHHRLAALYCLGRRRALAHVVVAKVGLMPSYLLRDRFL